jgi:hypothetical protein
MGVTGDNPVVMSGNTFVIQSDNISSVFLLSDHSYGLQVKEAIFAVSSPNLVYKVAILKVLQSRMSATHPICHHFSGTKW